MKRAAAVLMAAATLAALAAPSAVATKDTPKAKQVAAKLGQTEKRADKAAFNATYGPKRTMQTCKRAHRGDASTTLANAAQECREERGADPARLRSTYGTNANGKNAFGKCVSAKVRSEAKSEASEFADAAAECRAERSEDPEAFATPRAEPQRQERLRQVASPRRPPSRRPSSRPPAAARPQAPVDSRPSAGCGSTGATDGSARGRARRSGRTAARAATGRSPSRAQDGDAGDLGDRGDARADLEQAVLAQGQHALLAGGGGDLGLEAPAIVSSLIRSRHRPSPSRARSGPGSRCRCSGRSRPARRPRGRRRRGSRPARAARAAGITCAACSSCRASAPGAGRRRSRPPRRSGSDSMPIFERRVIAPGASLVCRVESTMWPVSAASIAIRAVSASRISPTMMMSGSARSIERSPVAKVSPALRVDVDLVDARRSGTRPGPRS